MKFSTVEPRIFVITLVSILCTGFLATHSSAVHAAVHTQAMAYHYVQAGESLSSIARNYGVSVAAILQHNQIPNPNILRVGQTLAIPLSLSPSVSATPMPSIEPSIEWIPTPQSIQIYSPFVAAPEPTMTDPTAPDSTVSQTQTPAVSSVRYYTVRRGDTLQGIAVRAGVSLSVLRQCNRFNGDTIYVGQLIVICG